MPAVPTLRVFPSGSALVQAAADDIVGTINRAIGERGQCCVALSGGETPRPVYRLLGSEPLRNLVEWDFVHFVFGDERAVPPDDPESNFGMIDRELFSRIPIPSENVHRIPGENDPSSAAQEYEKTLRDLAGGDRVRLDLILLGLGEDGHTASLFPGTDAIAATGSSVRPVFVPKLGKWRITLTLECINDARKAIFLVAGKEKADIAASILSGRNERQELPASLVRPHSGETIWMLDRNAAAHLRGET